VVGNAVEKSFRAIAQRLNQVAGLSVNMIAFPSQYWGQEITVTGLLTGADLLKNLEGQDLGDGILLPSVMLKQGERIFLDDMTVEALEAKLQTKIWPVNGVEELIKTAIGPLSGAIAHQK
jgi:NifB/MoaA-like Fe-S oxidoreductase